LTAAPEPPRFPVRVERDGSVSIVTIDRPERLNALDVPSFRWLRHELEAAALDRSVRCVLLTGAGSAFCAGGDVAVMEEHRKAGTLDRLFHELTGEQELSVRTIMNMPKPVVAALPGVAAGGGLSLALACDWRIASEGALLVPAFPQLGAVPDGGLTYLLPHYLGIGGAQELLFQNARLTAASARSLGLVHEVCAPAELSERASEWARQLSQGPTREYGTMKLLMLSAFSEGLDAQMVLERRSAVEAARGPELPEGIRAFVEKRTPRFPAP